MVIVNRILFIRKYLPFPLTFDFVYKLSIQCLSRHFI